MTIGSVEVTDGATTLRPGDSGDLAALVAFDQVARSSEERRSVIRQGLAEPGITIAERDGSPKAYALLHFHFFGQPFMELVYVREEDRRSGLGSLLIEHICNSVEGSKLFTSTNQSNTAMQGLLAKLGFAESGIIYNLDPGDPELVYFKSLSAERP